jgi:outer membrane protein assembly factor BamB
LKQLTKLKNILIIVCSLHTISANAANKVDEIIYLSKPDSTFKIVDSTLTKVWEISKDTTASYQPVLSDDKIFVPLDDGLVYCYDFHGKEKWVAEVFGDIQNNLLHYKDLILASTSSGDLYSINANNGDIVQVLGIGENITTNLTLVEITNDNTKSMGVIFGTESGTIFCYDIFSFELIWKEKLSTYELVANPIFIEDKVFFKDSLSSVYSVSSKSGSLIWKHEFIPSETENNKSQIFSDGKKIFILSPSKELVALDLLLGKVLWSTKKLDIYPEVQFSNDKKYFIVLNKKGALIFLSTLDGKEIKKIDLAKENINSFYFKDSEDYSLLALSDGSISLVDNKFEIYPLISLNSSTVNTLKILSQNNFLISTQNGKIFLFKFEQ